MNDRRTRIGAALKWAPHAVASHRSAAVLHGLDLDSNVVELSVPREQSLRGNARVELHRVKLPATARTKVQGLACTTVTRTLFDLAGCVSFIDLAIAVEAAWRRDARVLRRLRNALGARGHRGRGGVYALRTVADDCESRRKPLRSALEVRMWWLLHALDHPLPVPGYRFSDAEGSLEIDFAFPDQMVAVETDGRRFHGPDRFVPDARRQARLVAAGWRVPRFTFVDVVFHPEVVLTRVSAALTFGPGNPAASVEELATMTLEDPVVQPLQIPACDELYDWHGEERTR